MKNVLIAILILVCGFLAWQWLITPKPTQNTATEKIAESGRALVDIEVGNIKRKVDEHGIERALIDDRKQLISSYKQLKDSSKREIDSLQKLLNIRNKQLISYTSITSTLRDSLMKAINYGDSVYKYSDNYAKISFNRPKELFSLQYDAEVNIVEYWKRSWFLAPKKPYLELWLSDPRATINGVKRLKIEPKMDNFALKFKGVGRYNGKYQEVYAGGGVGFEARRFEFQGDYLYDFTTNAWYPSISGSWKLFEF